MKIILIIIAAIVYLFAAFTQSRSFYRAPGSDFGHFLLCALSIPMTPALIMSDLTKNDNRALFTIAFLAYVVSILIILHV